METKSTPPEPSSAPTDPPPPDESQRRERARVRRAAAAAEPPPPLVGDCVGARHPFLGGRVHVRWHDGGDPKEAWLASLQGLDVREGDRLILQRPANTSEWIVTGVVERLGAGREPARPTTLTLRPGESVAIRASDGTPLVTIGDAPHGERRGGAIALDGATRAA
jgi:hypothetical protein